MFSFVFVGVTLMLATSIAERRNDWVISPATVLTGIKETTSPYWDYRNNLLYYVTPSAKMIISWNPSTNESRNISVNQKPVFALPTENPNSIVVAFDDEIKKIGWDGIGDKKKEESLAKIKDAGSGAKILAGSVSYNGNLTFLVEGKSKRKCVWFLYTMQLDQKPFRINFDRRGYSLRPLDGIFYTCMQPSMHLSSSVDSVIYRTRYNQQLGITLNSGKQSWDRKYMPVGESKEDTAGNIYQIMDYKAADANILQLRPESKEADFAVVKVKMLTSGAWGGVDLKVFYVASKKTNKDKDPSAGGIFRCRSIEATGRPAFLFLSSLNSDVNFCETPKPVLKGFEIVTAPASESSALSKHAGLKGQGSVSVKFNWTLSFF